jgi:hypothetical protein
MDQYYNMAQLAFRFNCYVYSVSRQNSNNFVKNITFFWSHDFQKFNLKITDRALPVIPLKFTDVLVTQSEKIIWM